MSPLNKFSSLVSGLVLIYFFNAHVVESGVVEWGHQQHQRKTVDVPEEKKDTGKRTSIVLNWISVCQDLCSLNLAGPGCDSIIKCDSNAAESNLHLKLDEQFCEILCVNGLGGATCNNCNASSSVTMIKNENRSQPDFNLICTVLKCFAELTFNLKGCSPCMDFHGIDGSSPVISTPSSKQDFAGSSFISSSTPDWIGVCLVFCSQGQGGSACNCDKLPLLRMTSVTSKQ
uniref:CSON007351 protein n=1 Tax=Culicoides sonorensis TaxID=179676 RepID=A0A336KEX8_CULSO